jgi:hypothetical protein
MAKAKSVPARAKRSAPKHRSTVSRTTRSTSSGPNLEDLGKRIAALERRVAILEARQSAPLRNQGSSLPMGTEVEADHIIAEETVHVPDVGR